MFVSASECERVTRSIFGGSCTTSFLNPLRCCQSSLYNMLHTHSNVESSDQVNGKLCAPFTATEVCERCSYSSGVINMLYALSSTALRWYVVVE